jgi:HrpA-like RNA helicase
MPPLTSAPLTPFMNPSASIELRYELTDLGKHIAQLPLDPQLARLLLFGIAFKCLNPVVTLVAALSHRDPCKLESEMVLNVLKLKSWYEICGFFDRNTKILLNFSSISLQV